MKEKLVKRWYCGFCKASRGGHAGHMRNHETVCTLNPDRVCGMCQYADLVQRPMDELLALFPDPSTFESCGYTGPPGKDNVDEHSARLHAQEAAMEAAVEALRKITDGCPACILAALRQSRCMEVSGVPYFDYKEESQAFLDEHEPDYGPY